MKKLIYKSALLFCILFLLAPAIQAQLITEKLITETPYLLYFPEDYDSSADKEWPLLMYLHGEEEVGTDLNLITQKGPLKLIKEGKQFPFIVVAPQTPVYSWKSETLFALIEDMIKTHNVDQDRLYLTGLSMGGFGTWQFAGDYPNLFAAIIPICGGGNPQKIWGLRHTAVWCFHKEVDPVVHISFPKMMINALEPINPNTKFTIYPGEGHDSWTETYNNEEIYEWLLQQKRFSFKEVSVDIDLLKEYEGVYKGDEQTPLEISITRINNKLRGTNMNNQSFYLMAASDTLFFLDPNSYSYMTFEKENGAITKINIFENSVLYTLYKE